MLSLIVAEGMSQLRSCTLFFSKTAQLARASVRDETGYVRESGVAGKQGWVFVQKPGGPSIDQSSMQQWRWQWAAGQQCFIKTCIEFERADELAETERTRQAPTSSPSPALCSSVEDGGHVWLKRRKVYPTLSSVVVVRMVHEEKWKGRRGSSGAKRAWSKAGRQVARVKLELSCEGERDELKEKQLV